MDMLKIILNDNKEVIIEKNLYNLLEKYFKNNILKIEELKTADRIQKTNFCISTDENNINIITIINNVYLQYSQLLSYKYFKMYNYTINIKRERAFAYSDFKITLKSPGREVKHIYYLFNIEI